MSLINQMLKDLEKRRGGAPRTPVPLSDMQAISTNADISQASLWLLFTACVVFMVSIVMIKHHFNKMHHEAAIPQYNVTQPIGATHTQEIALPQSNTTPAVLTGITLQPQEDTTYLRFLISQNVLYHINADPENKKIDIVLEHTRLTTALPQINYDRTAIQHIAIKNQDNGDLLIRLTLLDNAILQHLELNDTGKLPEMQLDIYQNHAVETSTPINNPVQDNVLPPAQPVGAVKTLAVNRSPDDAYEKALSFAAIGQQNKAVTLLSSIIKQFPAYQPARQSLIDILMQKGDKLRADQLITEGLEQQPDSIPLIELKAKLLVEQGKTNQALEMLEQVSPALADNPDYYAFIAAVYQQGGRPSMAAKLYEQLLTLNSEKAIWWMGLGISLEAMGKHNQAVEAFTRADNTPGLKPELKAYVETQLS